MRKAFGISGIFRQDRLAGGVYSYFENLLRGFAELGDQPEFAGRLDFTVFHGRAGLHWHDDRLRFRRVSDRFGRFAAEARLGLVDMAGMDAALFANYFTPPLVRAKRTVTVIHDVQYLHMPEFHPARKRAWLNACCHWTLRACDAVVAISAAVKQDLMVQFGDRWRDRIHVVWNPVSLDRFDGADTPDMTGGRPYIMCVAMDRPQKNLYTLIRAFDRLKHDFPDHCLVMAGQLRSLRRVRHHRSRYFSERMPPTIDLVKQLGLQDRVIVTGFIPDAALGGLYRNASLFVLPSTFEGFGMPAVESLAMGAPTLVSDLPVLREVTMNRAEYVDDPLSIYEWADKIAYALKNGGSLRPSTEVMADLRYQFSPAASARKYLALLGA